MDTTRIQALTSMVAVLGLFVLMTLPALIGIARERRIDRQIKRAEAARAAAGRREEPAVSRPAVSRPTVSRPAVSRPAVSRPAANAAPHRTARAA
ncbi:hypothetical protein ACIA6T_15850 [Streptomyces sp. NPDC051740]|uniref:hypothetical protein n=1 Tax=Streptomyces sp. NPDC051740 TaxID=3365673 RepID=UPI0037948D9D